MFLSDKFCSCDLLVMSLNTITIHLINSGLIYTHNAVNKGHSTPDNRRMQELQDSGIDRGNLTRALTKVVITAEYHR